MVQTVLGYGDRIKVVALTPTPSGAVFAKNPTRSDANMSENKNQPDDQKTIEQSRRDFLKGGGVVAGGLAASPERRGDDQS